MPVTAQKGPADGLAAWIYNRHQILPFWNRRYFTLTCQILSCHSEPGSRVKWEVDLPGAVIIGFHDQMRVVIRSRGRNIKLCFDKEHIYYNWLSALQISGSRRVEDRYEFGTVLGRGAFGKVVKAIDRCTREQYAVKIIEKVPGDPMDEQYTWRELNCMRSISHPSIVNTINIFDTRNCLYLVLEYMPGGSLKKVLARRDRFSEGQTKSIIKDILQGVAYLHEMSIVHRDLKLDNILCSDTEYPFTVKIADFGLANFLNTIAVSQAGLQSQVGSPHYIAPEVLREERYGPLVDAWSIGVMMHIMLTKMYPFAGRTLQETLEQVVLGKVSLHGPEWSRISPEAKTLVKGLLTENVKERLSARDALTSEWFRPSEIQNRQGIRRAQSNLRGDGEKTGGIRNRQRAGRVSSHLPFDSGKASEMRNNRQRMGRLPSRLRDDSDQTNEIRNLQNLQNLQVLGRVPSRFRTDVENRRSRAVGE